MLRMMMKIKIFLVLLLTLSRSVFAESCEQALLGEYTVSKQSNQLLNGIIKKALNSSQLSPLFSIEKQANQYNLVVPSESNDASSQHQVKEITIKTGSHFKPRKTEDSAVMKDNIVAETFIAKAVVQCQSHLSPRVVLYKVDLSKLEVKDLAAYSEFLTQYNIFLEDYETFLRGYYKINDGVLVDPALSQENKEKMWQLFSLKNIQTTQYFLEYTDLIMGSTSIVFTVPLEKIK